MKIQMPPRSDQGGKPARWKHVETETKPEEYVVSTINQVGLPWKITIFNRETIYKWAIFHGYVSHNQRVKQTGMGTIVS